MEKKVGWGLFEYFSLLALHLKGQSSDSQPMEANTSFEVLVFLRQGLTI